jgi:hypothetical protein
MSKPKWEKVYYLKEGDEFGIDYILEKRKVGLVKDGDLWSSKAQFEAGAGFQMRANQCKDKLSYFSAWPGTYKTPEWKSIERKVGLTSSGGNKSKIYRVHCILSDLFHALNNDDEFKERFSANKAEFLDDIGKRTSADIVITHKDEFRRSKTLISIIDKTRKREIDVSDALFQLDIKQWDDEDCQDFEGTSRELVLKWWDRYEKKKIDAENNQKHQEERDKERSLNKICRDYYEWFGRKPTSKDMEDIPYLRKRIQDVIEHWESQRKEQIRQEGLWHEEKQKRIENAEDQLSKIVKESRKLISLISRSGIKDYEYLGLLRFLGDFDDLSKHVSFETSTNRIPKLVLKYRRGLIDSEKLLSSVLETKISSLYQWAVNNGRYGGWLTDRSGSIQDNLGLQEFFSKVKSIEDINEFLIQQMSELESQFLPVLEGVWEEYNGVFGERPSDEIANDLARMEALIDEEKRDQ